MSTTHIEMDGKMGCGVRIGAIVRLRAITLSEYEEDYAAIATSRWRRVCLSCESKASAMTGMSLIADLTCPFCGHNVAVHQRYDDSDGRKAMCRECPNRITEVYGDDKVNFVSYILPVCVLIRGEVKPEGRMPTLDANLKRWGLDKSDLRSVSVS